MRRHKKRSGNPQVHELLRLGLDNKIEIIECSHYHYQIKGPLLVNYYPTTGTAYVDGTTGAIKNQSPAQAIALAFKVPKLNGARKDKRRRRGYKGPKNRLFDKHPFCYWCSKPLTRNTTTLDHKIPLNAGGLDNANNFVIACDPCNKRRGCSMPEIVEHGRKTEEKAEQ